MLAVRRCRPQRVQCGRRSRRRRPGGLTSGFGSRNRPRRRRNSWPSDAATRPFGRGSSGTASGSSCELTPSRSNSNASARNCEIRDSLTPSSSARSCIERSSKKYPITTRRSRSGSARYCVHQVGLALTVEQRLLGAVVGAGDEGFRVAFDDQRVVVENGRAVNVVHELVHGLGRDAERRATSSGSGRGPDGWSALLGWPAGRGPAIAPSGWPSRVPRSSSSSAPRIRVEANRSNAMPRSGSKLRAACARPSIPADTRSLRLTWLGHAVRDLRHHVLHERQVLADQLVLFRCLLGVDLRRAFHSVPPAPAGWLCLL